jgi:hypothetical protein
VYFVVTLALKMLIYALVNSAFSGFAAPRLSESRGCLQTMPSVSGEKALKPKTTSFYLLSQSGGSCDYETERKSFGFFSFFIGDRQRLSKGKKFILKHTPPYRHTCQV